MLRIPFPNSIPFLSEFLSKLGIPLHSKDRPFGAVEFQISKTRKGQKLGNSKLEFRGNPLRQCTKSVLGCNQAFKTRGKMNVTFKSAPYDLKVSVKYLNQLICKVSSRTLCILYVMKYGFSPFLETKFEKDQQFGIPNFRQADLEMENRNIGI